MNKFTKRSNIYWLCVVHWYRNTGNLNSFKFESMSLCCTWCIYPSPRDIYTICNSNSLYQKVLKLLYYSFVLDYEITDESATTTLLQIEKALNTDLLNTIFMEIAALFNTDRWPLVTIHKLFIQVSIFWESVSFLLVSRALIYWWLNLH